VCLPVGAKEVQYVCLPAGAQGVCLPAGAQGVCQLPCQ